MPRMLSLLSCDRCRLLVAANNKRLKLPVRERRRELYKYLRLLGAVGGIE